MNIFYKAYARVYQGIFKMAIPVMPYREPKLLDGYGGITTLLKSKRKNKVLIVTDAGIVKFGLLTDLQSALKKAELDFVIYDGTQPNPTIDNIEEGVRLYKENECQAIIAIGGGSPMDCAKIIGARIAKPKKSVEKMRGLLKIIKRIPLLIAIPTTAGTGSETTLAAVITNAKTHHKIVINDFSLIPRYALLDEGLTIGLPRHLTSTTGMDALTHAVEAFIGNSTTMQTRKRSKDAVKLIFENIEKVYVNGSDKEARKNMLTASYYAGVAFTKSYVGYVHAIAHSLGGQYGVPHGLANAIILPHVLKCYGKKIHKKIKKLCVYANLCTKETTPQEAFNIFVAKIEELNKKMQIPTFVKELQEKDIDTMATHAIKEANPLYPVPVMYDKKQLTQIYKMLIEGNQK